MCRWLMISVLFHLSIGAAVGVLIVGIRNRSDPSPRGFVHIEFVQQGTDSQSPQEKKNNPSIVSEEVDWDKKSKESTAQGIAKPSNASVIRGAGIEVRSNAGALSLAIPEYPSQSRRYGEEGTSVILISRNKDDVLISLVHSSGFERLDEAALRAVKKISQQDIRGYLSENGLREKQLRFQFSLAAKTSR